MNRFVLRCILLLVMTQSAFAVQQYWSRTLEANIGSSAASVNGKLFFGGVDGFFYALDTSTGNTIWRRNLGSHIGSSPAISYDGNTVFVGTQAGNFYALKSVDGTTVWSSTVGGSIYSSPAISKDGQSVFVGSNDHSVYAFDTLTGAEQWHYETAGNVASSLAVGIDGTVYAGSGDGKLYALDGAIASASRLKWSYQAGANNGVSSPSIGNNGIIYVGSHDENLYALNPSGTELWRRKMDGRLVGSPVANKGQVFVASYDQGVLYALDASTGYTVWATPVDGKFFSSPAIDAADKIYIGNDNGNLYEINTDGQILQQFAAGSAIESSPIVDSGRVYFATKAGLVTAIAAVAPDSGSSLLTWSMFRQGKLRTGSSLDTDGDGIPDAWEDIMGLNKNNPADAALHSDGDSLTNLDEYKNETKPLLADTDGDGHADGQDHFPNNPLEWADTNGDGLGDNGTVSGFSTVLDRIVTQLGSTITISHNALLVNDQNPANVGVGITGVEKNTSSQASSVVSNGVGVINYTPATSGSDQFRYLANASGKTSKGNVDVSVTPIGGWIQGTSHDEILFGAGNGSVIVPAGGNDVVYDKPGPDTIGIGSDNGSDLIFIDDPLFEDTITIDGITDADGYQLEYVGSDLVMHLGDSTVQVVLADAAKNPAAYAMDKLIFRPDLWVTTQTVFAVNDYIIKPAPECISGLPSCDDADRREVEIYPFDVLGNDFSGIASPYKNIVINTDSTWSENTVDVPSYTYCWWGDCFVMKVLDYTQPVDFYYSLGDENNGNVSGAATARFRYVTGNTFTGTAKNESITGTGGDDVIYAGGGNDFIKGDTGNDTIHFALGDGQDLLTILDFAKSADKVIVDSPLTYCSTAVCPPHSVRLAREGLDLVLKTSGTNDALKIEWLFAGDALVDSSDGVSYVPFDQIQFGGSTITLNDIKQNTNGAITSDATYVGAAGADGTSVNYVGQTSGDDKIFGFAGADYLAGAAGNDQLYGGTGNDFLDGGSANDQVYGDAGNDWLIGGTGIDVLDGGAGLDTYEIDGSQNQKTINNLDLTAALSCDTSPCVTYRDAVWFSTGVVAGTGSIAGSVKFRRENDNLVFDVINSALINPTATTVTVPGYFQYADYAELDFRFKDIAGAGNNHPVVWDGNCVDYNKNTSTDDLSQLEDRDDDGNPDVIGGAAGVARMDFDSGTGIPGCMKNRLLRDMSTAGDDVIVGYPSADWISARAGNDTVSGGDGDDVIYGGAGNDNLNGNGGDNALYGEAGDDQLTGESWSNDLLVGGEGSDAYLIHADVGTEIIADRDTTPTSTEIDSIMFLDGTSANMLWFYLDDTDNDGAVDDLVIQPITTLSRIVIENWSAASQENRIEVVSVEQNSEEGGCTILNYSSIAGLLSSGVMPTKDNPPSAFFTTTQLMPYWSGPTCNNN